MDFVITALDHPNQLERRMANRDAHVKSLTELVKSGNIISAGAITNEKGEMIGSSIHAHFDDRNQLDEWLKQEPYVIGEVWADIDIKTVNLIDTQKLKSS